MTTISFFTAGTPRPAGSKHGFAIKKGGQYTGRVAMVDAGGQSGRDWRASVVQSAFEAMRDANLAPLHGPLRMNLIFIMPRPKYHYRSNGQLKPDAPRYHTKTPDSSKATRLVEDAMTKIVYQDDAQICEQFITKNYTSTENPQPGCAVEIIALDDKPET